jgi:uncharacterized protein (DUF2147 family)
MATDWEIQMRFTLMHSMVVWIFLFSGLSSHPSLAVAASPAETTPVGRWKTVDDATGKVESLVSIWEEHGKLYGKIEKIFDPSSTNPDPRCSHCQGGLKDRSLIGLRVLWDLKRDDTQWSGGKVLDPESGKIYSCVLALEDSGKKLRVRGFIGFSFLGRTQYWLRDEKQ